MKKTILALTIPALFATSASAVTVYSDEGAQVDIYGRVQYEGGSQDYQGGFGEDKADKADNFTGKGEARLGANVKYELNNDVDLIGKLEWQVAAEGNDGSKFDARYAWAGFRFMDTTDLTAGRVNSPYAQLLDYTDILNVFGGKAAYGSMGLLSDKVDDMARVAYANNGVDLRAGYSISDNEADDGNEKLEDLWNVSAGYTTPFGLGFGAAYEQQQFGTDNSFSTLSKDNDAVTAGRQSLVPATILASGSGDADFDAWIAGVNYSIDGFYFAALYTEQELEDRTNSLETEGYELHAQYNVDAWTVLAQYSKEESDLNGFKWDSIDAITLGVQYDLTAKAKLYAEYLISDSETLNGDAQVVKQDDLYGIGIQYNF